MVFVLIIIISVRLHTSLMHLRFSRRANESNSSFKTAMYYFVYW